MIKTTLIRATSRIAFSVVSIVALQTPTAHGRLLYVSTTGDDAPYRNGSAEQPWSSLAKAASMAQAGDTILIKAGTYRPGSSQVISCNGNATRPILFKAQGGTPVFDGSTVNGGSVIKVEGSYTEIDGFEVKNSKDIALNLWANPHHITIRNCVIHDNWKGAVYMGKSGSTASCHHILIENCTAYNNSLENAAHAKEGGWPGTIQTGGASYVVVRNNTIYHNHGEGISLTFADRCEAYGNRVHDNWSVNVYFDNATNCIVRGNFIYSTNDQSMYRYGRPAHGIMASNEGTPNPNKGNRIYNNIVYNNGAGFWSGDFGDGGLIDFTIANNVFYKSTEPLVVIGTRPNTNVVFINNIFSQPSGTRLASISGSGTSFHHNCWFNGSHPARGEGDILLDPKMKAPGGYVAEDYSITESSPCRDKGTAVSFINDDYRGSARPAGNTYDIGAFEFGGMVSTNQPPAPEPVDTGELVRNGTFQENNAGWVYNISGGASATSSTSGGVFTCAVATPGTADWNVQLLQSGITLQQGQRYMLRFRARAEGSRTIFAGVSQSEDPWAQYIADQWVAVQPGSAWQTYSYLFIMSVTDGNARAEFNSGREAGSWQIDDVSIRVVAATSAESRRITVPRHTGSTNDIRVDVLGRMLLLDTAHQRPLSILSLSPRGSRTNVDQRSRCR